MKKINIIKEKKDFDKTFKSGIQYSSRYCYLYIRKNDLNNERFGICISKKIGTAVQRNKIKRRIKDIIDKSKLKFGNNDYIIVLKRNYKNIEYSDLRDDLLNVLKNLDRRLL